MSKYSKKLKVEVVQDYLSSLLGYKLIAKKYGIKSSVEYRIFISQKVV